MEQEDAAQVYKIFPATRQACIALSFNNLELITSLANAEPTRRSG
jgi:hypothetical protein